MTTLVTGATGFVGSHLVGALRAAGEDVTVLVRDRAHAPADVHVLVRPQTATELADALRVRPPAVTFHLATHFVGVHAIADVEALVDANVLFGTQLAEAVAVAAPGSLLINAGTAWQCDEAGGYRPAALYAATKQALEDVLRFYATAERVRVANVRLFDTYGPGDTRGKLLAGLDRAAREGTSLQMSPGAQLIDLTHVDDVVAGLRAVVPAASEWWSTWSLASGDSLSLRDLVERFAAVTGRRVPVDWGARPYRPVEMFRAFDAGRPVPGWAPRITLEDGLRATFTAEGQLA